MNKYDKKSTYGLDRLEVVIPLQLTLKILTFPPKPKVKF